MKSEASMPAALVVAISLLLGATAPSTVVAGPPAAEQPSSSDVDQSPDIVTNVALAERLEGLQSRLRAESPDRFGGLWIDDANVAHVAFVGSSAKVEAIVSEYNIAPSPVLEPVTFSEATQDRLMTRVQDALTQRSDRSQFVLDGVEFGSIYSSIPENRVLFNFVSGSPNSVAALQSQFGPAASFRPTSTRFHQSACTGRTSCGAPVRGGTQLYKNSGAKACTTGITMDSGGLNPTYYTTSAGHCWFSTNTYRYNPASHYLSDTANQPHRYQDGIDMMWIRESAADASNWIYYSTTSIRVVTSSEPLSGYVIGESVCSSKMSGNDCGKLTSTNICQDGSAICGMHLASLQYACGGDSGSAVYQVTSGSNVRALGNISAASSGTYTCPDGNPRGSDSVFSPIAKAELAQNLFTTTSAP